MNYYMGIDIGTSGCKAIVFDENGRQISAAYREYDIISPQPGWGELDSDVVMNKCFEVITESAGEVPGKVRGLGISSQGEAFTPIDGQGRSLANALVSSDQRATSYVDSFPRNFGAKKLYEITGHTAHPMFSLFKILWLKENRPDIWHKADMFLCFEDLLQFRLGLDPAIGWPLAGRTMLFDVRKHEWNPEILEAIELSKDKLARTLPSGTKVGVIKLPIVAELGLAEGAFVVTGGHDQTCGALGAGVTEPGVAAYATGTVDCSTAVFGQPVFSELLRKSNLCTYDYAINGMYTTVAFNLTGGNILKWFRDEFGQSELAQAEKTGLNAYELLLKKIPDKPTDLMVLPYFTSSGTPNFDTKTPGAMLGLRLSTRREEIMKGLLEGVALEMRLNLELLGQAGYEVNELRAIGGGAKSQVWTQLKADVMNRPITVLNITEAGCLGVAMLAKGVDTNDSAVTTARQWTQPISMIKPQKEVSSYYSEKFEKYKNLYPLLKSLSY